MNTTRRTAMDHNGASAGGPADKVVGDMSEFAERAKRAFGGAGEFASHTADNAVRGGKKAAEYVVKEVREHPLRTLAIGAAIGAVVAAVIMLRKEGEE